MKLKKLLKMLLVVGACAIPCASSFASGVPDILWDKQAIDGIERKDIPDNQLVDQQTLITVGKLLDQRIKTLELQGKLPFKTVVVGDYQNNTWKSKLENKDALALIPVITSDVNTVRYVKYKGITYYAYDIIAELNVMLCSFDGKNLKIVYNIPLGNRAVLGDSLEDAIQEPLTKAELKEQYNYNLEQLIATLEFDNSIKQIISAPEDYPTYQVSEVRVGTSVRNNLSDARINTIAKPVIASSFTNKYANKYKDRIVLPSKESGMTWRKEIIKHISSSDISSGEYSLNNEADADVEIVIKLNDYAETTSSKNKYSIMEDIDCRSSLEALEIGETGEQLIAFTYPVKNYRVPKDIAYLVQMNYIDIFSEAAERLADRLPVAMIGERKKKK